MYCILTAPFIYYDHLLTKKINTQERIISQWTSVQAELASFSFPQIGSISHFSKDGDAVSTIGPLATAVTERFSSGGPFATCEQYFAAVGEARYTNARKGDPPGQLDPTGSDGFGIRGALRFLRCRGWDRDVLG